MFFMIKSYNCLDIKRWDRLIPLNERISLIKIPGKDSKVTLTFI